MSYLLEHIIYFHIGSFAVRILPIRISLIVAEKIADLVYTIDGRLRGIVHRNLKPVLSYTGQQDILEHLALQSMKNFSERTVDYFRLLWTERSAIGHFFNSFSGEDKLRQALSQKKGVILLGLHLGHYILGAALLASLGYKVNVVARLSESSTLENWRTGLRKRCGLTIIKPSKDKAPTRRIMKMLKKNEIVCMLADRTGTGPARDAIIFERDIELLAGPGVISAVTGAPILPAYTVKSRSESGYDLVIEDPLDIKSGQDRNAVISDYVVQTAKVFERLISIYPDQWYNFYDYWYGSNKRTG